MAQADSTATKLGDMIGVPESWWASLMGGRYRRGHRYAEMLASAQGEGPVSWGPRSLSGPQVTPAADWDGRIASLLFLRPTHHGEISRWQPLPQRHRHPQQLVRLMRAKNLPHNLLPPGNSPQPYPKTVPQVMKSPHHHLRVPACNNFLVSVLTGRTSAPVALGVVLEGWSSLALWTLCTVGESALGLE